MGLCINRYMVYTITCGACKRTDEINTVDGDWRYNDTPSKYFKRQGWISGKNKNICPKCTGRESEY